MDPGLPLVGRIEDGEGQGVSVRVVGLPANPLFALRPVHARYRLEGSDLMASLPLTPWEAALGAKVTVPTLAGKVDVSIPAGARSGQKLRLKGRGLPGQPPGGAFYV